MKKTVTLILVCILAIFLSGVNIRAGVVTPDLQIFLHSLDPDAEVPVIVTLNDQVELKKFKDKDKRLRRTKIIKTLKAKSKNTQKHIVKYLQKNKAKKIKPFWIFNGLAVTLKARLIEKLAGLDGVEDVRPDGVIILEEPQVAAGSVEPEWNINLIRAPEFWSQGFTGTGVVLASMDTGVDYLHSDLYLRWRGGSNSWYDPNGEHLLAPYDNSGHGTQVMGVMVGGSAGGTAIGVAPGAQWIAVKIFDDAGNASYSDIHSGYQWLLDPDDNPATDDAPDIVNNSWGLPNEAGTCLTDFQADIGALKAARIGVVFSGGNSGPYPYSSESPANNPESFAVGAVDAALTYAHFSSHGPSACDGTVYPEVVAPGVNIYTADLTFNGTYPDSYYINSGTSFAAPHVAGAMGLLLSADPSLTIGEIEAALTASALDLGDTGPDNSYGYGLLDVMAAADFLGLFAPNMPPIANNDIVTTPRNLAVTINILANDLDPDGGLDKTSVILRSATTTQGAHVAVNGDGAVTYTPEGGGGPDYFWYRVNDDQGAASNEARVRVNRVRESTTPVPAPSGLRDRRR